MKNTQTIQNLNFAPVNWNIAAINKSGNFIKKFKAVISVSKPFAAKKQIAGLQQDVINGQQEIEKLQWELVQKNELVKNISFHQSHTVRKPLANILGIIELINNSKNEQSDPDILEMISLLKISADELDRAIKYNSSVSSQ